MTKIVLSGNIWRTLYMKISLPLALTMAKTLNTLVTPLKKWLSTKLAEVSTHGNPKVSDINMVPFLKQSVQEMMEQREGYEEIRG